MKQTPDIVLTFVRLFISELWRKTHLYMCWRTLMSDLEESIHSKELFRCTYCKDKFPRSVLNKILFSTGERHYCSYTCWTQQHWGWLLFGGVFCLYFAIKYLNRSLVDFFDLILYITGWLALGFGVYFLFSAIFGFITKLRGNHKE